MKFDKDRWQIKETSAGGLKLTAAVPLKSTPSMLITLCHGFGATGLDLFPLAKEIVWHLSDDTNPPAFLFPEAPIDLSEDFGGEARAWWQLNMARLMQLHATDSFDLIRDEIPPGIDEARNMLQQSILDFQTACGWSDLPLVIGGFSQGAMLSVDTVLRSTLTNVKGLIVWSGALVCESKWKAAFQARPFKCAVIQTHGRTDPVLPFSTGKALNQLFREFDLDVEFHEFMGPHTIPEKGIAMATKLIESIARSALLKLDPK